MPEQISKYPDVTLKVLKGAGAVCGEGTEQRILKQCPADQFCALPTGEICVYGLDQIPQMTQITLQEMANIVCPFTQASMLPPIDSPSEGITLGLFLILGLIIGRFLQTKKVKKN